MASSPPTSNRKQSARPCRRLIRDTLRHLELGCHSCAESGQSSAISARCVTCSAVNGPLSAISFRITSRYPFSATLCSSRSSRMLGSRVVLGWVMVVGVLVGIMPLQSSKHTEFIHNELAGVFVPDDVREGVDHRPPLLLLLHARGHQTGKARRRLDPGRNRIRSGRSRHPHRRVVGPRTCGYRRAFPAETTRLFRR